MLLNTFLLVCLGVTTSAFVTLRANAPSIHSVASSRDQLQETTDDVTTATVEPADSVENGPRAVNSLDSADNGQLAVDSAENGPQAVGSVDSDSLAVDSEDSSPGAAWSVKELAGITSFPGFFDPLGISTGKAEARIKYYREAELKHGRVAMLAALGFPLAEVFHPLWGGNIDEPSYIAFQATPLQRFWPLVLLVLSWIEISTAIETFKPPGEAPWTLKDDYASGDLGFDPLGLKPKTPAGLREMQTKELNNGRLAMIGIAGMVAQELVTGSKLF